MITDTDFGTAAQTSKARECREIIARAQGTETHYIWNRLLFPRIAMTESIKMLAKEAGAYWLLDAIAYHVKFSMIKLMAENPEAGKLMRELSFWKLERLTGGRYHANGENEWILMGTDGNLKTRPNHPEDPQVGYIHQCIPRSDFPLDEGVTIYCQLMDSDKLDFALMLPGDY
jgi:hypothetical protein